MQYEKDHKQKPGIITRETMFLKRNPDMSTAARQGDPAMTNLRPSVPPLVPQPAGAGNTFTGEVSATPITNSTALDTKPDARANPPAQGEAAAASPSTPAGQTTATDPSKPAATDANAKKKKKKDKKQPAAPTTDQPASATPAAAQPAAPPAAAPSN
jgi:hypothetical protein